MGYLEKALEFAKQAEANVDGDGLPERQAMRTAEIYATIAQAEALARIAAALEELATCVDPEVAFFWTRQFQDRDNK